MTSPVFPDEILQPYEPAAPSHVPSPQAQSEKELESEATPSPPPAKRAKIASSSKKGKEKMSKPYVESESEKEEDATGSTGEDSDIAITKEVHTSGSRRMKHMAQFAKQRRGLRSSNA